MNKPPRQTQPILIGFWLKYSYIYIAISRSWQASAVVLRAKRAKPPLGAARRAAESLETKFQKCSLPVCIICLILFLQNRDFQ